MIIYKKFCIVFIFFITLNSSGGILSSNSLKIDFTDQHDVKDKATFSPAKKLNITKRGLGFDGETNSSIDGWIKTKPLAIGLSWRPASSASISISISPKPKEITLPNGQKSLPNQGSVFVRYSPDMQNWSTWIMLNEGESQNQEKKTREYFLRIGIPEVERSKYNELLKSFSKLDVPWKSDEEAAVKWILKKDPEFFAKSIPFMGYVEFLFEGHFTGDQRIKSFNTRVNYSLSGFHHEPKNNKIWKDHARKPWRFKLEGKK